MHTLLCLLLKRKEEKVTQVEPRHLKYPLSAGDLLPTLTAEPALASFHLPTEEKSRKGRAVWEKGESGKSKNQVCHD